LTGETAQAADQQFAKLFCGEYSVAKLAEAMRALGDAAQNQGTQIQYTKLQILTTLAIAAGSIIWALANAEWSLGGSLAEIPVAELLAESSIRELVSVRPAPGAGSARPRRHPSRSARPRSHAANPVVPRRFERSSTPAHNLAAHPCLARTPSRSGVLSYTAFGPRTPPTP
jgi:hypothetical protein